MTQKPVVPSSGQRDDIKHLFGIHTKHQNVHILDNGLVTVPVTGSGPNHRMIGQVILIKGHITAYYTEAGYDHKEVYFGLQAQPEPETEMEQLRKRVAQLEAYLLKLFSVDPK